MREERSLTFFAFIVGENVRQDAPSSELKFVRKMQTLVKPMAWWASASLPLVLYHIAKHVNRRKAQQM